MMIQKPLDCYGVAPGGRGKLDSRVPAKPKKLKPMLRTGFILQKQFAADGKLISVILSDPAQDY